VFHTDADKLLFLLETEAELSAFLADETLEAEAGEERPRYITNYIGSKQKLTDWIWKSTPDDVETAVDAFSGSSVVAYMFKTHGLGVHATDRLAYCHHIARAIVENDSTTLSDEEIEKLLAPNAKAKDFVRKHFKGVYFQPGVHAVIDTIRSNIDSTGLEGFKRDIALFALGKACITGKGGFGHFGTTKQQEGRADDPKGFQERFAANCRRISALVFKGERPCKAHHGDTRKILPGLKADAAYFDPPYATQFSQTNYERAYHFVEGLMTWWDGKEIQGGSQTKQYEIPTEVTRANASQFFQEFLGAAKHIPHWIISYRDQAFPSEKEIKKIVAAAGKASRMKTREHQYHISAKHGENSTAKEHLFVCTPATSAASSAANAEEDLVALADFGEVVDDSLRAAAPGWDEAENEYRYRVRPPDQFAKDSFRTKQLDGVDGVSLVTGRLKPDFVPEGGDADSMVVQSVRFKKDDWDLDEAKKWFDEHRKSFAEQKAEADLADVIPLHADADPEAARFFLSLNAEHDPDLLEALAAQKDKDAVRVTAFMGNKYFILDFLWKQTPKDAKSVLDAFSGGANVGYFYKRKGLRVVANDKLAYPHAIARALIENSKETLTDEEIEGIFADNSAAGDFCEKHFYQYYFTKPILHFLDVAWANIQKLQGYKLDLALAALGWTVVGKAKFGQFSRSKKALTKPVSNPEGRETSLTNIPLSDFQHRFRLNLARINKLVFDNGQENKATRMDGVEAVRKIDCDLVYADPPYITQFGTNDYEMNLHFVEGLMTMWKGKELRDNPRRDFASSTRYTRETIATLISDIVSQSAARHLLLSYRDKAYPDEKTIRGMFQERFKQSRVTGIDVQYAMIRNDPESGGKYAKELVFIGSDPTKAKAAPERNIHTRVTGELETASLTADAAQAADKRFRFILTHVGTNRNGDHFTPDELREAAKTAVGKKIDLSHSQEFRDIVGGIVESKFVEDGDNSRVECIGELFTDESEPARLAYKLMKRSIVGHVSMECDYQEGECSICGRRVKSKAEYCTHLKNYKGRKYQGKPVYEILHGITFTGMGLLDREGADDRAEIRQVADHKRGGNPMGDETKKKTQGQDDVTDPSELSEEEKDKLIRKQQADIDRLNKELDSLRKKLDDSEASRKAVVRKTKAETLLKKWEEAGRQFESDDARTAEMDRLLKMSDEGFEATVAAVESFAAGKKKKPEDEEEDERQDTEDEEESSRKKKPKKRAGLNSEAGGRPRGSPDTGTSLEERLASGFMAAYNDRIGNEA